MSCSLRQLPCAARPHHGRAHRCGARQAWATDVILLGHHYQRDEVIRFADFTGDSYKLSKVAAETDAKYMVFCGVHFMAETRRRAGPAVAAGHSARPERRLLDGRYGGDRAGGRLLGLARRAWASRPTT